MALMLGLCALAGFPTQADAVGAGELRKWCAVTNTDQPDSADALGKMMACRSYVAAAVDYLFLMNELNNRGGGDPIACFPSRADNPDRNDVRVVREFLDSRDDVADLSAAVATMRAFAKAYPCEGGKG